VFGVGPVVLDHIIKGDVYPAGSEEALLAEVMVTILETQGILGWVGVVAAIWMPGGETPKVRARPRVTPVLPS
jgi:hypothetical protein